MEEKERYRLIGFDTSQGLVDKIYDTKKDIIICSIGDADDVGNVIDLLNQQDKRIEELEEQLKNAKKETAKKVIARVEELGVFDFEAHKEHYTITGLELDCILREYGE